MFILMVVIFIIGYTIIALEHPLKIDKAATALLMGTVLWAVYALNGATVLELGFSTSWHHFVEENNLGTMLASFKNGSLSGIDLEHFSSSVKEFITQHEVLEHLANISTILFFLLGAMTIVETVDQHEGFKIITDKIKTTNKVKLLWVLSFLTFFMSAVLDNLTTTIVIIALLRKLIDDPKTRWFYAAMVVVAANAGGAFSPIGDVTTIMLWIGGQVTTANIIAKLFLPSLLTMVIPLILLSFTQKGNVTRPIVDKNEASITTSKQQAILLIMGVSALLFVPVFKTYTHLPPYLGMLFGLSIIWITTELMHKEIKQKVPGFRLTVNEVLRKVDIPTIFFFLGILSAVAALESAGHLDLLAHSLKEAGLGVYAVSTIIGLLSSVVDNVPLVAASMGMYPIDPFHIQYMQDGIFWELIAYTAGTGGSILIIGSAAGVAAMGLEKIDFIWYMKKISLLAMLGYFAGIGTYYIQESFMQEKLEIKPVSQKELPPTVNTYLNDKYANYQIEAVNYYVKHDEPIGWAIDLKDGSNTIEAQFLANGRFFDEKSMEEINAENHAE
ncbi:MAG: sodium:proton antiporter [Bacteroidetes bacterium]|nr:MAG: sodium:proton antiporter [Bacteroidota bacterium]